MKFGESNHIALFDHKAATYDDWCATPLGGFVDSIEKGIMKEAAKPKANERALDLGCGTGVYSYWLWKQGLRVTGIDISGEMLEMAKAKLNTDPITFVQGDVHALPFPDETFDLVIANITLEFTEHPDKIFGEVFRVLKRGGRFVCGFIGKESAWGRMYEEKGKHDESSVFSKARLFNADDVKKLSSIPPVEMNYGLYVDMNEFVHIDQARLLEKQRAATHPANTAGYMVAKWMKESF